MKQLIFPALALPLLIVCCTKEASVQTVTQPSVINVDDMSAGMSIMGTRFTANEVIAATYNITGADNIVWYIQDTIPYIPDSNYHYPSGDTIIHYPDSDTLVDYPDTLPSYPGDTIPNYPWPDTLPNYPGGDTIVDYPGSDTLVNYPDTIPGYPSSDTLVTYPGSDSTGNTNNGYILTVRNKIAQIKIFRKGNYVLVANAYRHNANGTYSLISKGYVQLKAY